MLGSNNIVYSLSAQIVQLRVVSQATSHLMDKINEITHKGAIPPYGYRSGFEQCDFKNIFAPLAEIYLKSNPLIKAFD